jgi:hypothetical protein
MDPEINNTPEQNTPPPTVEPTPPEEDTSPTKVILLKIVLPVVALLVVLGFGQLMSYLVYSDFNRVAETTDRNISELIEQSKQQQKDKTEYLTYTTEVNKVSFDYPSDWQVTNKTKVEGELTASTTFIKSPSGYTLYLNEVIGGGIGGYCVPEEQGTVTVHKEADTEIDGIIVISRDNNGNYLIEASKYSEGIFDIPISYCDVYMANFLGDLGADNGGLVTFGNSNGVNSDASYSDGQLKNKPNADEYPQVVKILASLRKS